MAKKQKSSEKELKGFLLSRFFFVLAIVSVVELIAVGLTNAYLIPALVTITHYDKIIKFLQAERDFMSSKPKKSFKDELVTDISTGYYEAQRRAKG